MVERLSMIGQKRPPPKSINPKELEHRFGAKSDFVRYFKESCKY